MSETPIYDQLALEKQSPVYFADGSEIGYISIDGLSFETDETDETGGIGEWDVETIRTHLQTSVKHSIEFKVLEFSREAAALFYGYDLFQLAETVKEWLRRPPMPFPAIPKYQLAEIHDGRNWVAIYSGPTHRFGKQPLIRKGRKP